MALERDRSGFFAMRQSLVLINTIRLVASSFGGNPQVHPNIEDAMAEASGNFAPEAPPNAGERVSYASGAPVVITYQGDAFVTSDYSASLKSTLWAVDVVIWSGRPASISAEVSSREFVNGEFFPKQLSVLSNTSAAGAAFEFVTVNVGEFGTTEPVPWAPIFVTSSGHSGTGHSFSYEFSSLATVEWQFNFQ